ncbi:MAG: sugar O-acyltransferase, sialic acid O-acetyltransferase NeuD family [Acidobacteria bacterium]|nr:sugar O-acyltransferase, sialic acid O-acetyltransferase NeuD family [Acidobacteriota bacterium]
MSKVVIFGAGKIADEAYFYLKNDSPHEIVAFTIDAAFMIAQEKFGLPVVPFEEVVNRYPPTEFKMFVAVGYQDLNKFRASKYEESKARGYELISYVSSRAANVGEVEIGDNCFVLEFAVIQPCSKVGNNVFIWSGNHIGHHASVGDHCYIAGNVVVSGNTKIEPYCFIGVSATLGHEITIGRESLIGAGCLITKNVEPGSVYITPDTPKFRLDSGMFQRLTKMK